MADQSPICHEFESRLSEILEEDAALASEERTRLLEHAESCARCSDALASLTQLVSAMGSLPRPKASAAFSRRLRSALDEAANASGPKSTAEDEVAEPAPPISFRRRAVLGPLAALILLALGLWVSIQVYERGSTPAPSSTHQPEVAMRLSESTPGPALSPASTESASDGEQDLARVEKLDEFRKRAVPKQQPGEALEELRLEEFEEEAKDASLLSQASQARPEKAPTVTTEAMQPVSRPTPGPLVVVLNLPAGAESQSAVERLLEPYRRQEKASRAVSREVARRSQAPGRATPGSIELSLPGSALETLMPALLKIKGARRQTLATASPKKLQSADRAAKEAAPTAGAELSEPQPDSVVRPEVSGRAAAPVTETSQVLLRIVFSTPTEAQPAGKTGKE